MRNIVIKRKYTVKDVPDYLYRNAFDIINYICSVHGHTIKESSDIVGEHYSLHNFLVPDFFFELYIENQYYRINYNLIKIIDKETMDFLVKNWEASAVLRDELKTTRDLSMIDFLKSNFDKLKDESTVYDIVM